MKKLLLVITLLSSAKCISQEIKFITEEYNFGIIKEGESITHEFNFTNTSDAPLTLNSVTGSCGCLSFNWSREFLHKNQTASIKITFNTNGKVGQQDKTVTVISNSSSKSMVILHIKGEIIRPEANNNPVQTYPFNFFSNPIDRGFNPPVRSYISGAISLTTDSINYYDSRILGSWVTDDKKWINIITKNRDGTFSVRFYQYQDNIKKYGSSSIRFITGVANIESLNFFEIDFGFTLDGVKKPPTNYIPCIYKFINENEVELASLSRNFIKEKYFASYNNQTPMHFKDNYEYRNFVKNNYSNNDLFNKPIHYTRLNETFEHIEDNDDGKAMIGIALLLVAGYAILQSDGGSSSISNSFQPYDRGKVIGLDAYYNEVHENDLIRNAVNYDTNYQPK
jgi:hypothetical protein